jgi:hypothetical protein
MPREGAIIFRDNLVGKLDVLTVECEKCRRLGRYRLDRLIERYALTPSSSSGLMRSRRTVRESWLTSSMTCAARDAQISQGPTRIDRPRQETLNGLAAADLRRWRHNHRSWKVSVMPDELRPDLVFAMSHAIDKMLLS